LIFVSCCWIVGCVVIVDGGCGANAVGGECEEFGCAW
jgi:hypothetical protein